jgi:hypothetical protein
MLTDKNIERKWRIQPKEKTKLNNKKSKEKHR